MTVAQQWMCASITSNWAGNETELWRVPLRSIAHENARDPQKQDKMLLGFAAQRIVIMAGPTSTSWTLLRKVGETPTDRDAWEDFVRRYGPAIFDWCRRWGLQQADADDVTQIVLLKLVGHMKSFKYDPAQSFRSWLKTVTYHAWAKFCAARGKAKVSGDALASLEAREDLASRLEQEYDREMLDLAMVRVSQRVASHTWEAFRLLALEGLSGAEAARRLDMKVATAYVARSKVQRMIQEELLALDKEAVQS
jgi:RNA polymerase sigma-70 factor (ECF subfamily)